MYRWREIQSDHRGAALREPQAVGTEMALQVQDTAAIDWPELRLFNGIEAAAPGPFGADHLVTGSDYPVLQDYETCKETFVYIERLDLPAADRDKIPHHNAQARFAFAD